MSRRLVLFRRGVHNLWRIWQNRSVSVCPCVRVCVSVYLILLIHFKISVHRKYIGSARAGVQCTIFNSALWPSLQSMLKLDVYTNGTIGLLSILLCSSICFRTISIWFKFNWVKLAFHARCLHVKFNSMLFSIFCIFPNHNNQYWTADRPFRLFCNQHNNTVWSVNYFKLFIESKVRWEIFNSILHRVRKMFTAERRTQSYSRLSLMHNAWPWAKTNGKQWSVAVFSSISFHFMCVVLLPVFICIDGNAFRSIRKHSNKMASKVHPKKCEFLVFVSPSLFGTNSSNAWLFNHKIARIFCSIEYGCRWWPSNSASCVCLLPCE